MSAEAEKLQKQNQALRQTIANMGAWLESSLRLLSAISGLTAIPLQTKTLAEAADGILEVLLKELENVDGCSLLLFMSEEQKLKFVAGRSQTDVWKEYKGV